MLAMRAISAASWPASRTALFLAAVILAALLCCEAAPPSQQQVFTHLDSTEDGKLGIDSLERPPIYHQTVTESVAPFSSSASDDSSSWIPPLSTRGRYIVDARGRRVRLKAGNWHGASGTYLGSGDYYDPKNHHAGEQAFQTPLCLDRTSIEDIVQGFVDLGINSIRFPFSNAMIFSSQIPPNSALRANPQFQGMTPLEIYDACIAELTRRGLAVILNNHTNKERWCCGVDENARWNSAQSDEEWENDWIYMVRRYRNNHLVVGAELYNEVRRDILLDPEWGSGKKTDWFAASQRAGTRILREANPDILIIIEGINYVGVPTKYTNHYRPELQPVQSLSHTMPILDKLVYSSHFYAYTGPNATGGPDLGSHDVLYRDLTSTQLEKMSYDLAFYVATPLEEEQKHYTNPVFISETGSAGRNNFLLKNRSWWANFTSLLIKYDIDFALWPLVGWQERGKGDLWALNAYDSHGSLLSIQSPGDWRLSDYDKLMDADGKTGEVEIVPQWRMLSLAHGSMQQSNRLYKDAPQMVAALQQEEEEEEEEEEKGTADMQIAKERQASCPDGLRLVGLGYDEEDEHISALCTDAFFGRGLWDAEKGRYEVISASAIQVNLFGQAQLQCSSDSHLIGFSVDSDATIQSITCAHTTGTGMTGRRTGPTTQRRNRVVNLDQRQDVGKDRGGWHSFDAVAASCNEDELLSGLIFTHRTRGSRPSALICQS